MAIDDLLRNALESIENGVEDYSAKNPKRTSSAVRNLYAGVLLLLKEKLRRESPPGSDGVLMYARSKPHRTLTGVVLVPDGKATVDFGEIQRRFTALDLKIDWARLRKLKEIRDNIEHHKPAHPEARMREALGESFLLVRQILEDHLDQSPPEALGSTWQTMLSETALFREIDAQCRGSRKGIEDIPHPAREAVERFLACPSCDSALLLADRRPYLETSFTCQGCGERSELNDVIAAALDKVYPEPDYYDPKDPPEKLIAICPTCDQKAFSVKEDSCLACGESRPYDECLRCGETLNLDEQDYGGLCGYCEHVTSKDD
jgi:hypothetical protein